MGDIKMNERMKVLVADDNRELAVSIQDILEENGYSATTVFSGRSAIEICEKNKFDLVLLDYKLPDMDGMQLQEKLSKMMDADYIIITAHASIQSATEAVQRKRIVGYETKPLDFGRLLAFIHQIATRRLAERNYQQQAEFLELVIESLRLPFYIVDVETCRVIMANSAANFGELVEKSTCHKLTHRSNSSCDQNGITCPIAEIKKTGKPTVCEHLHYDENGNLQYLEIHAYPIFDDAGKLTRIIEYCHNITDRKQKEEETPDSKGNCRIRNTRQKRVPCQYEP
jgi:CheY-like chemotaxis protein